MKSYIIYSFLAVSLILCGLSNKKFEHPDTGVSIDKMKESVKFLCAIKPARNYRNLASLEKSAKYISNKMKAYGLVPKVQEFKVNGSVYKNIIASVGPKDSERIIIGAHYDVCGKQPGADDNGSGIAGLLEIARFVKKFEKKIKFRIDIVAYSLEEPPFFGTKDMGSYIHAESLHKQKIKVHSMLALEMIGFYSDKKKSQKYPLKILGSFYPDKANFISVVGDFSSSNLVNAVKKQLKFTKVKVESIKTSSMVTGMDFSDHRNYWKFDYKAAMITDTAFYRNANYHRKSDTPDTLDYKRMKEVVKGICWYILNAK
jgi:Peptidase family M28